MEAKVDRKMLYPKFSFLKMTLGLEFLFKARILGQCEGYIVHCIFEPCHCPFCFFLGVHKNRFILVIQFILPSIFSCTLRISPLKNQDRLFSHLIGGRSFSTLLVADIPWYPRAWGTTSLYIYLQYLLLLLLLPGVLQFSIFCLTILFLLATVPLLCTIYVFWSCFCDNKEDGLDNPDKWRCTQYLALRRKNVSSI